MKYLRIIRLAKGHWVDSSGKKLEPGPVCKGCQSGLEIMCEKVLIIVEFVGIEISLKK